MLFLYNIVLTILYSGACLLSLCDLLKERKRQGSYLVLLLACLLVSQTAAFGADFLPGFSQLYQTAYRTVPVFHTFISLTVSMCLLAITSDFMGETSIKKRELVILFFLCVLLLFLPGKHVTPLRLFLYRSAPMLYLFYRTAVVAFFLYKENSKPVLCACPLLFSVVGIAENGLHAYRNISYDVFFALCCLCYMIYFIKKETAPQHCETESSYSRDLTKTEKDGIFYRFCDTYSLTPREQEILTHLFQQGDAEIIATTLTISARTVNTHIHHIHQKTGTSSRQELFALYESFLHSS